MRAPAFWQHGQGGWRAFCLAPIGWMYERITLMRLKRSGWRADVPVLCIGNFTAGGGGKTPTSMAVATALLAQGETPFFLSRGYGGALNGPVRVSSAHKPCDVGDEPLLLAQIAPVIVAKDRAAGARMAIAQGASVIVLDDGMQNPALLKDFTLAVIDGGFGLGNGQVIPAGPLRARIARMHAFFDAVLVIGAQTPALPFMLQPVYTAQMTPDATISARLSGKKVVAFAGIARPEKFYDTLRDIGCEVMETIDFPDHHPFSDRQADDLMACAQRHNAILVTTQKDAVRLADRPALAQLRERSVPVSVQLTLPDALNAQIYEAVLAARKRISTASVLA